MINLTTSKKLDKFGIIKTGDNFSIGYAKHIYSRNVSIEELLELLPVCVNIYKSVNQYEVECRFIEVKHKSLVEALARLLIKLKEEGLI